MDIQHTFLCSLSIRLHLGVGPGGPLGQFAGAVGVNGCAFVFSFWPSMPVKRPDMCGRFSMSTLCWLNVHTKVWSVYRVIYIHILHGQLKRKVTLNVRSRLEPI